MKASLSSSIELCKLRIGFLSAFSSVTGYLLAPFEIKTQLIIMALGVFMLSCGSSALNQYQERSSDAVMPRTCNRPLPTGRIRPERALYFSLLLVFSGALMLMLIETLPALLGLLAVIWYNGVYTHLKKKTAFAMLPGALVGAIPPAIGWTAAGGGINDPRMFVICFFFFIWQVPHFWLLIMSYGREYEKAGFPSLTGLFSERQLGRIVFVWMSATAVSCLFLYGAGVVHCLFVTITLLILSLWLIFFGAGPLLSHQAGPFALSGFRRINMYLLMVMMALAIDRIFVLS